MGSPEDLLAMASDAPPSAALKLFLLMTVLSFAPALVLSVTSFARIVIVMSLLRQALGAPQLPPNPIVIGMSLFLTFFVMAPTLREVHADAIEPFFEDRIGHQEAGVAAAAPLKRFMIGQTRARDLALFVEVAGMPRPSRGEDLPIEVVVPAFLVSELTQAFRMGLYLFLPLLLIDLLVAAVLMSLGMMMVPPSMVSLPVKLAVFVLADGWHLVVTSLIKSFE